MKEVKLMRSFLTSITELVGAAAVAVGLGLAWLPLGVIAAGVTLMFLGYVTSSDEVRR